MSGKDITLTPETARRLGESLVRRRVELGFRSARKLGLESNLDYRTITSLESGKKESVTRSTLAVLEIALRYPQGFLSSIANDTEDFRPAAVVEIEVPPGASQDAVDQARKVAQATFNAVIESMEQTRLGPV